MFLHTCWEGDKTRWLRVWPLTCQSVISVQFKITYCTSLCDITKVPLPELFVVINRRSKGWACLISGKFFNRLKSHIIVRKCKLNERGITLDLSRNSHKLVKLSYFKRVSMQNFKNRCYRCNCASHLTASVV